MIKYRYYNNIYTSNDCIIIKHVIVVITYFLSRNYDMLQFEKEKEKRRVYHESHRKETFVYQKLI